MNVIAAFYRLQLLRRRVRLPLVRLEAIQTIRLRALLKHAYLHVPYYRDLMERSGLHPDDVRTVHDLRHLPVTSRATLRSLPAEAITADNMDPSHCDARKTSGSESGEPWHILVSPQEANERALVTIRSDLENGYRIWQRQGFVQRPPFRQDTWFKRMGILKSLYISLFDDVDSQVERLRRFSPDRLNGQPSSLERIARYVSDHSITDLRPRLISTMGERLRPEVRALLEQVFGGEVYDRYGTTEGGILGWECGRHQGYHLNMDQVMIECTHGDQPVPPGEVGAVALTNVNGYVRPLIRVAIGDMAQTAEGPCPCGSTFPLLASVLGRQDEFLSLPDGRWLSPGKVESALAPVKRLTDFQLVQETPTDIRIVLVASDEAILPEVRRRLLDLLGAGIEVTVERREAIPLTRSGKVRRVISRLDTKP